MYLNLQREIFELKSQRNKRMLTLISPDSFLSCLPSGCVCVDVCVCLCMHVCVRALVGVTSSSGRCSEHMSAVSMVT